MNERNDSIKLRETIRKLERKLGILEESELSCCNISLAQCHALVEIGRAKTISLNELAELLNLENSTMSRTVSNLVNSGYVKRDIDATDRRYLTISLTENGQDLFNRIEASMGKYYRDIFDQIEEAKRGQVIESLNLLLDAVEKSNCCCGNNCC
ncbi:MAG: MarR family transcriptional regulator [Ethanoligenens sp.]|uniref:MarR family winged helix-turn-helix transcriptional regulator n=1 Tax=Ethanoligenens sp. TaxID=2099655 RepID=UPI0039EB0BE8